MHIDSTEKNNKQKLGLLALTSIVVSSMIGSGVDGLPQNMAENSCRGPGGDSMDSLWYRHVFHLQNFYRAVKH